MILEKEQITKLLNIVELTVVQLYEKDLILFEKQVHERAIAFRFAIYFQELIRNTEFGDLDLDFEYNKREGDSKITPSRPNGSCPDLILHKRGSQDQNTLVLEFKCVWSKADRDGDFNKLIDYTLQNVENGYYYGLGIFLELGKAREQVRVVIFQDGSYE